MRPILAIAVAAALCAPVHGALIVDLDAFTGSDLRVRLTLSELTGFDVGKIGMLAEVVTDDDHPNVGDLRGVFLNFASTIGPLWSTLSITGADVTGVLLNAGAVNDTGRGNNVRPAGPFDIGIALGTPGMSHDDIQSSLVVFSAAEPLSIAHFLTDEWNFAARATSVGPLGGKRGGSSKLLGIESFVPINPGSEPQPGPDPVVPEPATGAIAAALALLLARRPQR